MGSEMCIRDSDETCLRFAEAYDREDAAQRGEADPHAEKDESYAEWAAERVSCVRAGLAAVVLGAIKDHADAIRRKRDG